MRTGKPIFLDRELTIQFPVSIDREKMIVHKIIVAHGAAEACRSFSDANVYGSLAVAYGPLGAELSSPFFVELDRDHPVHVFDSHNLEIIMGELDTVFDLSSYLDKKIEAIKRYDCLMYCGEEDLLAHYFLNYDRANNRHFIGTKDHDINCFMIGEGEWKDFVDTAVYKRKKAADRSSYLWDEILQKTTQNALDGTLLGNSSLLRGQSAMHEMAKEPRFSRRALAAAMMEAIESFPETSEPLVRNLSFMPSFYKAKGYVFLQLKNSEIADYEDHRQKRQAMLQIACGAAKNKFPELNTVIGIAIDASKFAKKNAEDFLLMDCRDCTQEDRAYYEHANEGFNIFNTGNLVMRKRTAQEFPAATTKQARPARHTSVGRNDLCPCGSGRKYKRCCLK